MMTIARKPRIEDIERLNIPTCRTCGRRLQELTPECKECREKEVERAEGD